MKKTKTLKAVKPNKGIEIAYRKKLLKLIDDMQKSVTYWLEAEYKKQEPIIAKDAVPADELAKVLRKRLIQWQKNFNRKADEMAKWFVTVNNKYTETALKDRIKTFKQTQYGKMFEEAGFTFDLKMTPELKNVMRSFVIENVNLIKSIPKKYFTEVEGMVMRSVRSGRDLEYLSNELEHRYGITKRRAILIARDQNNKATEQLNRTRQQGLGVKKGIWRHAGGVKEPRHSHELADGKIFDLDKGLKVDGEFIFPGQEINCFPSDAKINGFSKIEKLFRRSYTGELSCIRTSNNNTILRSTPNHPYLTLRGWVKAKDLKVGDKLVKIKHKGISISNCNEEDGVCFENFFKTFSIFGHKALVSGFGLSDFHGDGIINQKINIVLTDSFLSNIFNSFKFENMTEKFFKRSTIGSNSILFSQHSSMAFLVKRIFIPFQSIMRRLRIKSFLFNSPMLGRKSIRFLGISGIDAISLEKFVNKTSACIENSADFKNTFTIQKKRNYFNFFRLFNWCWSWHNKYILSCDEIINIDNINYKGFVYNLQTKTGFYTVDSYIVKNCHCYYEPVMEEFL